LRRSQLPKVVKMVLPAEFAAKLKAKRVTTIA
jgi:hypothetical protein